METFIKNSDQELLDELRNSQPKAFETLFNLYWKELYTLAFYRLRDHTFAEDMVQDVFANIWARRRQLEINGPLIVYLRSALKYHIIKWLSRADLHQEALKHLLDRMGEMEATILDVLVATEVKDTLDDAITDFPENMRRVFTLRMENYSIREIAEALGLAEQTVKNNTSEALGRLKNVLADKHPDIHQSFFAILLLLIKN
jgi:RNA polymerase sigma factor (sigma-70 family)